MSSASSAPVASDIEHKSDERSDGTKVRRILISRSSSTDSNSEAGEDKNTLPLHKVIILGDSETGKTSILMRFDQDRFCANGISATVGVGYATKVIPVDEDKVKLQIWDTAGQERFRSITRSYYRGAEALILVYDVTSRKSFENIRSWLSDVYEIADNSIIVILLGNKSDLDSNRQVPVEEGRAVAQESNALFLETSAKLGSNVNTAFTILARQVRQREIDPSAYEGKVMTNQKTHTKCSCG